LTAAGYTGIPTISNAANTPFPFWRCIANALLGDEPAEKCNGLLNRSRGRQYNYGLAGQVSSTQTLWGRANQFVAGFAHDRNTVRFGQSTELGYLNPDRSVTGVNAFGDGVTGGEEDGEPFDVRVDLRGKIRTYSVYASNNLALAPNLHLTLSGRLNHTAITNRDRIQPGGGPGSLDGDHSYLRFNPAVGLTFSPKPFLNAYVSYSEGSRAPTSIELGCADPDHPCRLPNSLAGDPPLEQVVTRTFEAGLRAAAESRLRWNVGYYLAENRNDILFVASRQVSFGYFKNFGQTRRQGLELGLSTRWGRADFGANYSLLEATFQSPEVVNGAGNSSNDAEAPGLEGFISIRPGDRIPLTPRHSFKAFSTIDVTKRLAVNVNVLALSGSLARGNENGKHKPDGRIYLGPGQTPAYGIVNVGGTYKASKLLSFFVQVQNLFDQRYYTASQLGATGFTAAGNFQARPFAPVDGEYPLVQSTFFGAGAPRLLRGGFRLNF
jgi:outer membrane receptor protein involved in Fe transport